MIVARFESATSDEALKTLLEATSEMSKLLNEVSITQQPMGNPVPSVVLPSSQDPETRIRSEFESHPALVTDPGEIRHQS